MGGDLCWCLVCSPVNVSESAFLSICLSDRNFVEKYLESNMRNSWTIVLLCIAIIAISVRLMIADNNERDNASDASDEVIECIMTRASVRKYKPEKVNDSIITEVLKAGMAAPTAANQQAWHFVVITNQILKDSITDAFQWTKMVEDCAFAVVVCGDMSRLFEGDREESGFWLLDCSAASENMLLAAHALGLGGVWCGIYPEEDRMSRLSAILNLPTNLRPINILSFGYPETPVAPKQKWDPGKVSYNRF